MRDFSASFTGIEAVIVLIAFVVVAAVFSYTIISTGFYTTQKAQETVYRGVEQSTTNIKLIGNVYGLSNDTSKGISEIKFCIGLEPGSPVVDLTKMRIVFSTPTTTPIIFTHADTNTSGRTFTKEETKEVKDVVLVYSSGSKQQVESVTSTRTTTSIIPTKTTTAATPKVTTLMNEYASIYTTKENGATAVYLMESNQQVEIDFPTEYIAPNTRITIEIRPSAGASISFSKTVPATITDTNVLY
jgi:archaeal flagellin FlaB